MRIDEAIAEQQLHLDGDLALTDIRLRKAIKLGIEALKRLQLSRKWFMDYWRSLLPGETEE